METRSEKEIWKRALTGAEVNPSSTVWEGVELQLDKGQVVQLRKEVLFYKLVAAACVSFAVVAFAVALSNQSEPEASKLVESIANVENEILKKSESFTSEKVETQHPFELAGAVELIHPSIKKSVIVEDRQTNLPERGNRLLLSMGTVLSSLSTATTFKDNKVYYTHMPTSNVMPAKSPLVMEETTSIATELLSEKGDEEEKKNSDNRSEEKFWTSIGVAAGTFNNTTPTSVGGPANALSSLSAGQTAASETNSSGSTYSVNVAVGTKISKRWLVQGGISYISQVSDYTATAVVAQPGAGSPSFAAASINQFEKKGDRATMNFLTSTPYSVDSEIQMISFPVQAGYLLVDRKLALQVNSGISTDLFMQNTITPQAENLDKTTQGRGDDSPYRPVNFSGLVGTELSYRFSDQYRVSLSPGLRYPFNSIYKSDLGIKSSPLTFDVALRFRYILK